MYKVYYYIHIFRQIAIKFCNTEETQIKNDAESSQIFPKYYSLEIVVHFWRILAGTI